MTRFLVKGLALTHRVVPQLFLRQTPLRADLVCENTSSDCIEWSSLLIARAIGFIQHFNE